MRTPEDRIHVLFVLIRYFLVALLYIVWAIILGTIFSGIIMAIIFLKELV